MSYYLSEINARCREDAAQFIADCDRVYAEKLTIAADRIMANMSRSPIVLLSGPSGSGKTTTAMKIAEALSELGIGSKSLAMDSYFRTVDPNTSPRTADGKLDLESPKCLDLDLLGDHLNALAKGKQIRLPIYNFVTQIQAGPIGKRMKLGPNEVVVCEGIHALNDDIVAHCPGAIRLYISARSNVMDEEGKMIFKGTWMRLMRRLVRDNNFRGTNPAATMEMWANVRRGEKKYISPFKESADLKFDTAFASEVSIMKQFVKPLLEALPETAERYDELRKILPTLDRFADVDPELLAPESLLREFIGGGVYDY